MKNITYPMKNIAFPMKNTDFSKISEFFGKPTFFTKFRNSPESVPKCPGVLEINRKARKSGFRDSFSVSGNSLFYRRVF